MVGPFAVVSICVLDHNRNRRWAKMILAVCALGGTRDVTAPGWFVPDWADCGG